jgi:hypothetical protein
MSGSRMRAVGGRIPLGIRLGDSLQGGAAATALFTITLFANALIKGDRTDPMRGAGILIDRNVFSRRGPVFFAEWDRSPPQRN